MRNAERGTVQVCRGRPSSFRVPRSAFRLRMIQLDSIAWRAGAFRLENVSFIVPAGRYAVLMGRTGCGKTTLIEIICGLRQPRGGRVIVADRDVTHEPPGERGIGRGFRSEFLRSSHGATAFVRQPGDQLAIARLLEKRSDRGGRFRADLRGGFERRRVSRLKRGERSERRRQHPRGPVSDVPYPQRINQPMERPRL